MSDCSTSITTLTSLAQSTVQVTVAATTIVTFLGCPTVVAKQKAKRASSTVPKPSALSTFSSSGLLSSACSCLSLATPKQTISSVTTVPVTGTSTVNVIATSTVTPATQFATFDVTATVVGSTVTQQTTVTSYTATVTNTVTQTHTYDAFAAAPTFSTFKIKANVVGNPSNAANGDYGVFNDQQSWVAFTATDTSSATVFTLDSSCHLSVNGGAKYAASNVYGNEGAIVVFIGPGNGGLSGSPNTYAACNIILDSTQKVIHSEVPFGAVRAEEELHLERWGRDDQLVPVFADSLGQEKGLIVVDGEQYVFKQLRDGKGSAHGCLELMCAPPIFDGDIMAAAKVLGIPEILEPILINVADMKTLLLAKRINKTREAVITRSHSL
nr:hypothetical protein B0A51_11244 [Rachicladosporium sp. CCFEE 5018]